MEFARTTAVLDEAITSGAFPGAVALVGRRGEVLFHAAFGARSLDPERTPLSLDTLFDLSSLTKPLATTSVLFRLVRDGRVGLDEKIVRVLPNFSVHKKNLITVRHLLGHCSGLAAWRPFHRDLTKLGGERPNFIGSTAAKLHVYGEIHREALEYPTASKSVYSDLGFILIGELVETVLATSLDRACQEQVFKPLGLATARFMDQTAVRMHRVKIDPMQFAPTERCPWRNVLLCGAVHDDNAWAMGGVAGHAGLFATAADVHAIAARWHACFRGEDDFLPSDLVREAWTRTTSVPGSTWGLGWDTPSPHASSAGTRIGPQAVGHLGFTGTSIWIDPVSGVEIVLLTNRVHPRRDNERIREVRPRFHDAVMEDLEG